MEQREVKHRFIDAESNPLEFLEDATVPIINEMFQNGPEKGCRLWEDPSHPLQQAFTILFQAQVSLKQEDPAFRKKAMALIEQHRGFEQRLRG